jgi:hypothetical protein
MKITIGIDPDSKAHGFAVYEDWRLVHLSCKTLLEIKDFIENQYSTNDYSLFEAHIEDVNAVSAAFTGRDKAGNLSVKLKMAQHIGKCKQAQIELERLFDYFGIKIVHHKISKQWKSAESGKNIFEQLTGWSGRSNEDTRSAAYFGYLGSR